MSFLLLLLFLPLFQWQLVAVEPNEVQRAPLVLSIRRFAKVEEPRVGVRFRSMK